ncbi:MAG TPA: tetratricopeptide repeat protein, partial [Allosphingosinicella sp.]|nr:tetratricopeptide repeat protein [Allosphingosinicella sp.]
FRRSAAQNYVPAQFELANMLSEGRGTMKSPAEAVLWYRRAAKGNYPQAQINLGLMYAKGEGVRVDNVAAYKWLSIASWSGGQMGAYAASALSVLERGMSAAQLAAARDEIAICRTTGLRRCD